MKPSQHVFQSFWFGDTVSPYEKMCLQSFLDQGHAFELYTYSPQLHVPRGVQLKDATELFDRGEYFTYKKGKGAGSHAAFSNLFRYKLLADRGGWWVDTDVVCLSSEIPTFDDFFALQEHNVVNGAVLFFRPRDPLMLECLDEALRIGDDPSWGEIGPRLVTRKLQENGRLRNAQPSVTCYPVHHSEALDLLRPQQCGAMEERVRQSLFLHLWNEVLRRVHVAKTMLPPRGSFLRAIVERHPVDGWSGEYDADVLEHALSLETELQQLHKEIDALRRQPLQRRERKRQKSDQDTGSIKNVQI